MADVDSAHYKRIGSIGGYVTSSRIDPRERGRAGQQGLFKKFLADVDPTLPEDERERRARAAMSAHFARMRQSSVTKAKRKAAT
jgi:hypothetical protein